MALNTSNNAYEEVYQASGSDESGKYCDGYVEKKETFMKWSRYWCVLKEQNIHFFKDVNTQIKENYVGFLALEQPTNVEILKSKGEKKYHWAIKTKKGRITLRTTVASLRDDWINGMEKSLKNEPPSKESYILDGSGPVQSLSKQKGNVSPKSTTRIPSRKTSFPGCALATCPIKQPSRKSSFDGYSISEDQAGLFKEFSSEIEAIVEDTDEDIRIQDQLLNGDKGWYQALYRRGEVEKILSNEERGVFIVRDYIDNSTQQKMGYVISLKDEIDQMRHHRIREIDGTFVIIGYEGKTFDSLHNLLRFFLLSQRNKLTLVPFNPKKQKAHRTGYEDMDQPQSPPGQPHPLPGQCYPGRYRKVRSKSTIHGREPSPPLARKDPRRSNSFQDHRPPTESLDVREQTGIRGYMAMKSPTNRPLPTPPSQDSESSAPRRPLPNPPGAEESYINVPPPATTAYDKTPSCYENTAESPYISTGGAPTNRPLPTPPSQESESSDVREQTEKDSYVAMKSPTNRPLPTPPSQESESSDVREQTEKDSYLEMKSPTNRPLPTPPSQDSESSDVREQTEKDSYVAMKSPTNRPLPTPPSQDSESSGSYINTGGAQVQSEPAPTLPPKRRIRSLRETPRYVNWPSMPERNPFRKSHTLPNV